MWKHNTPTNLNTSSRRTHVTGNQWAAPSPVTVLNNPRKPHINLTVKIKRLVAYMDHLYFVANLDPTPPTKNTKIKIKIKTHTASCYGKRRVHVHFISITAILIYRDHKTSKQLLQIPL